MKSGTNEGPVFASGKYPCGVCNKGVGRNLIYCIFLQTLDTQKMKGFERKINNYTKF